MPTKIMYLADHYAHPHGGTEGQLLQLLQHLDRSRYEPSIALFRSSDYIAGHALPCPQEVLHLYQMASSKTLWTLLRFAWRLRREGYRLVHCFFNDSSIFAPPLLRLAGLRVIVSRRDMGFWYTPKVLGLLRMVQPFVAHYIANSRAVKSMVQQQEWVGAAKVTVIYNGYIPSVAGTASVAVPAALQNSANAGPIVGIVANLRGIKRIDVLITAMVTVLQCYPNARLVVVGGDSEEGGGSMLHRLQTQASQLGILPQILFTGSSPDPLSYVRHFDVAVLCSESEGFSNSIMQYMEAGCAIVATDTGGNSELIKHRDCGLLVPVGDAEALAGAILELLGDKPQAQRFGEAARQSLLTSYSVERMSEETMRCYDGVSQGAKPLCSIHPREYPRSC